MKFFYTIVIFFSLFSCTSNKNNDEWIDKVNQLISIQKNNGYFVDQINIDVDVDKSNNFEFKTRIEFINTQNQVRVFDLDNLEKETPFMVGEGMINNSNTDILWNSVKYNPNQAFDVAKKVFYQQKNDTLDQYDIDIRLVEFDKKPTWLVNYRKRYTDIELYVYINAENNKLLWIGEIN